MGAAQSTTQPQKSNSSNDNNNTTSNDKSSNDGNGDKNGNENSNHSSINDDGKKNIVFLVYLFTGFAYSSRAISEGQNFSAFVFYLTNGSASSVGFLTGLVGMTQIVVAPIMGIFSDKYPRVWLLRRTSFLGLFSVAFSTIAICVESYPLLCLTQFLWGIFWSMVSPTIDSILADATDPDPEALLTRPGLLLCK